ncbi:MAG: sulfatase [Thermoanaerobaculia bacterium]|nr:sulfatase [Thermoanaerobaculia bacterium]
MTRTRPTSARSAAPWGAVFLGALASGVTCSVAAAGLVAVLARQVVTRGRYPVFDPADDIPTGFVFEWAVAALRFAWPAAATLVVVVFVAGACIRARLGGFRRTAGFVGASALLGLVVVALAAARLRDQVEDDRPEAGFLPPSVPYGALDWTPHQAGPGRPDIVLLTIDTLRADHLGFMGYERDTSPHLDRLAARGVSFTAAIAPAPMTQHSLAAMLTGQPVHAVEPPGFGAGFRGVYMRDGFHLLAERLREAGYATAGFVANPHLKLANGFGQGFDSYDDTSGMYGSTGAARQRHSGHVVDSALAWLNREARTEVPIFVWLHVVDPHHPYEPENPGPWEDVESPAFQDFEQEYRSWTVPQLSRHLRAMEKGKTPIRAGEVEYLKGRYDAEILQADRHFGRLLEGWAEAGRDLEKTLFVVTSDHGEEFQDHGGFLHAHTLFDELIHVPLVIAGPGFEGARTIDAQASLLDLKPTILRAAGALPRAPPRALAGRPLQDRLHGRAGPNPAPVFRSEGHLAFRTLDRKLISKLSIIEPGCPGDRPLSDLKRLFRARYVKNRHWPEQVVEAEIYDLATDPGEERLLDDPWETHRMVCRLGNYLRNHPRIDVEDLGGTGLSEEDRESLRALGYVID